MFNVFKTVNLSKIERAVQAMHATNGPKTVGRKHAYNHDVWLALEIGLHSLNIDELNAPWSLGTGGPF